MRTWETGNVVGDPEAGGGRDTHLRRGHAAGRRVATGASTFLSKSGRRVERARGGFRMCELGLVLIGDHELTLPPSTYPWDESRRRDELYWGQASLAHARRELV